ncbi:MAG: hypothetical protein JWN32_3850 [Solirubrobacterales bacterium]|nr:hypothetical protein [Solirubrobacterales bacterium]
MRALLLSILAVLVLAAPAGAAIRIGVGDESPAMFTQPAFTALGAHMARYFVPWDAKRRPASLAAADAYVDAARDAGVQVLMHISTNDYTHGVARLPSVAAYRRYVGFLVDRYRARGVVDWGVWNEENHISEPTYRSPRRAAQFFVALRGMCPGCRIVALDVLDTTSAPRYVAAFYRALGPVNRRRAAIVGIHNYEDVNRQRRTGTGGILAEARRWNRRVRMWWTETGGLVNTGQFPCNERRAASRTTWLLALARHYRASLDRLYVYSWRGNGCDGFDAGLTRPDGTVRPAYATLLRAAHQFAP